MQLQIINGILIGELTQLCMDKGIKCYTVQSNVELAKNLALTLGIGMGEKSVNHQLSGSGGNSSSQETNDLLRELSAAEKLCFSGKRPSGSSEAVDGGAGVKKKLGTKRKSGKGNSAVGEFLGGRQLRSGKKP